MFCNKLVNVKESRTSFVLRYDDYQLTCAFSEQCFRQAYQLRGKVFCRELGWVNETSQGMESDGFDNNGVFHLGVKLQCGNLAAYLRLHPAWTEWMIDSIFSHTVPAGITLHQPRTCEVSRLVVAPEYRKYQFSNGQTAADLIYQLLFAFCRLNDIDTVCMIVSMRVFRALRLSGLPCRLVSRTDEGKQERDTPKFATLSWPELLTSSEFVIKRRRLAFLETERRAKLCYQTETEFSSG